MKFIHTKTVRPLMVAASLGLGLGCADDDPDPVVSISPTEPPVGAGAVQRDTEVVGVMLVSNEGEVDQGSLAQVRAQNSRVRAFAEAMVSEHGVASQRLAQIMTAKGLTAEDSDVSRALESRASARLAALQPLIGAVFDEAYIDAQVAGHTEVLRIVDEVLTPVVRDADLGADLRRMRASVAEHLVEAQQIQRTVTDGQP